ncbi:CBS domain-containing protein [endosymbiont GvMRE of Glomus versiforme]|uniref:CBS domain-containing protein n=1 Tax=endosymbiont GvMRE of Glomus versiforme TaxID=2039283 RepID=UPI000ED4ED77|nr:CBS domain-containing protein [endosymbiont GvMRE of Glomus versiforme]RHZ37102.1 Hymolysin-related protein [endosymbiont GvMRE of Glomus versiforme]
MSQTQFLAEKQGEVLNIFANIIMIFLLLFITGFLNFISSLYSDIDISKVDLSKVNRRRKKVKKLIYIIKNNYFLFVGTSILSVVLNVVISRIIFGGFFGQTLITLPSQEAWSWVIEILTILLLVVFTEIFVRYLAEREFAKRRILNSFFLNSAHLITRMMAWPLRWVIKEKKLSPYREQDLIRLIGNLEAENVLEAQEVRLLKAAFNFDEESIAKHFRPRKKVILLSTKMTFKEIQQIYYKYHYTRYPVLSEERELVGILNFKTLGLEMKDKHDDWQKFIEKKINYLEVNAKLNTAFETCQKTCQHLIIVVDKQKRFIGIITLEDILENLVGKITDENEISQKRASES